VTASVMGCRDTRSLSGITLMAIHMIAPVATAINTTEGSRRTT